MERLKLGILGNGFLAEIIVEACLKGLLPEYELAGVFGRTPEKTNALAEKGGCRACSAMEELLELKPDYIAEAASVQAVKDYAVEALNRGANLVVLSIGAFADQDFYRQVRETASAGGRKVHMASGAVGGFDVLRTISLMGQAKAGIRTKKGPQSLAGTPLFEDGLMVDTEERRVFSGNAKEAIGLLPTKVNVAVAASLATVGPGETSVNIFSVPGMTGDDHMITSEIQGVKAVIDIYSKPAPLQGGA